MSDTLTGTPAKNYVGGEWRESASGESYEKRNPVAAVAGDRRLSGLGRSRRPRGGRGSGPSLPGLGGAPARAARRLLRQGRHAIEARAEQIAQDMTAEMGKPLREARLEAMRAATILRFAAGEAWRPIGELYAPSVPNQRLYTLRRPLGVVAPDHALELPDRDPRLEARPGAHPRQHGRPEARLRGAAHRPARRRVLRRGRTACRASSTSSPAPARRSERSSSGTRTCARSRSPAPCPSAARCARRRRPATAACSSSSAATTRSS